MNKQELLKKFGKNVKIERIKRDLTQEKLAELVDKSQNYIACIECGRQNMSLGKVLVLALLSKSTRTICCHCPSCNAPSISGTVVLFPTIEALTWA